MFATIKRKIKEYIIQKVIENKVVDIVEVRTQNIGLTAVITETDIKLKNTFFLPIKILSIRTDLLNKDGIKIGKMNYDKPQKIKGNSEIVLTSTSEISIITSIFQAISQLLAQSISMRSVGVSVLKILRFTIEIPVDDVFEIHPSKIKMMKEETEEERIIRKEREQINRANYVAQKEALKEKRIEKRNQWKEDILKRRYKENYITKEERIKLKNKPFEDENLRIDLDEQIIEQTTTVPTDENVSIIVEKNEIETTEKIDKVEEDFR